MSHDYENFLAGKSKVAQPVGFEADDLHPSLFPFQRDLVTWALRQGRCAIFADTGMGKSRMQLEWARQVSARVGRVLILAPLAVAAQTAREGAALGTPVALCREPSDVGPGISITNYDRLHRFDPSLFGGVVLDESSCIKHHDTKTLAALLAAFGQTPFRAAFTATPAPNDFAELGTHAEFLGICTRAEMLSEYFVHDASDTQTWRLKGHARQTFWRWVASWGALIRKPSDLGYDDAGYALPPLTVEHHVAPTDTDTLRNMGVLFAEQARDLTERRNARKASIGKRVQMVADLVNADDEQWIVWGDFNAETQGVAALTDRSIEVAGPDEPEYKEMAVEWFTGMKCICSEKMFSAKLSAWKRNQNLPISESITPRTEPSDSPSPVLIKGSTLRVGKNTCAPIEPPIQTSGSEIRLSDEHGQKTATLTMSPTGKRENAKSRNGKRATPANAATSTCGNTESPQPTTTPCSQRRLVRVRSVDENETSTRIADSTSTIAMQADSSEGCSVPPATSDSESLATTPTDSNARPCICGHLSGKRVLISKASMFGYGLNLQNCARMAFVGVSDSWESYYQAVRRCYRFGQKRSVAVHVFSSEAEGSVIDNLKRKEADAKRMSDELSAETSDVLRSNILRRPRRHTLYQPSVALALPGWLRSANG